MKKSQTEKNEEQALREKEVGQAEKHRWYIIRAENTQWMEKKDESTIGKKTSRS